MSASIALKDASTPRGNPNYASAAAFKAGRTLCLYVNGKWAGAVPTGPYGVVPAAGNFGAASYGAGSTDMFVPDASKSGIPAASGEPVVAQDNTDGTTATTTLTTT